jgi:hypothetical protein
MRQPTGGCPEPPIRALNQDHQGWLAAAPRAAQARRHISQQRRAAPPILLASIGNGSQTMRGQHPRNSSQQRPD